ncbi:MAG TPA: hypothetical protein VIL36_13825 [Acidimicrobiales bacterium]
MAGTETTDRLPGDDVTPAAGGSTTTSTASAATAATTAAPAAANGNGAGGTIAGTGGWTDTLRVLAALALVGAGVIHFAYAPGHLDTETSHGVFFLVAGWVQLALAAVLALRARPERVWLAVAALANLAAVGVWVVSRTVGVPGSEAEDVGFPDVAATAFEVVVVLACLALLGGVVKDRAGGTAATGGASPFRVLTGVGALATIAVVSMAVSPSFAGDHGAGGHSHGGDGDGEAMGADHHDDGSGADHHGGIRVAGVDMTDEQWAQHRYDSLAGYSSEETIERFEQLEAEYLSGVLLERSELLQSLPEAERQARIDAYVAWAIDNTIDLLEGAQAGDPEEMHSHGPMEWQPIEDPEDQVALQEQLQQAGAVIQKYPNIAAAEAAGYHQISPYVPGIGAHWINNRLLDTEFDPAEPEMLLFNGTEPTSELVGLSYAAVSQEPVEGFVGPNDVWHAHPGLCMLGGLVIGIDGTPEDLCESVGGNIASGLSDLQMAHLWQVPGWESPWGLFSAENPLINVATSDLIRNSSS